MQDSNIVDDVVVAVVVVAVVVAAALLLLLLVLLLLRYWQRKGWGWRSIVMAVDGETGSSPIALAYLTV